MITMKGLSKLLLCTMLLTVSFTVGYVPTQATPVETPADYTVVAPNADITIHCCDLFVEVLYTQDAGIVSLINKEADLSKKEVCLEEDRVTVYRNDTYTDYTSKRHVLRMPSTVFRC